MSSTLSLALQKPTFLATTRVFWTLCLLLLSPAAPIESNSSTLILQLPEHHHIHLLRFPSFHPQATNLPLGLHHLALRVPSLRLRTHMTLNNLNRHAPRNLPFLHQHFSDLSPFLCLRLLTKDGSTRTCLCDRGHRWSWMKRHLKSPLFWLNIYFSPFPFGH